MKSEQPPIPGLCDGIPWREERAGTTPPHPGEQVEQLRREVRRLQLEVSLLQIIIEKEEM